MTSRLPYLSPADFGEEDRDLIRSPINLQRGLANNPAAMRLFAPIGQWMRWKMPLDARLREMAILQVAYLLRNAYEFTHHLKIMAEFGVTAADVQAIIDETNGRKSDLAALDRAVLEAARTLTADLEISDACWAKLHERLGKERTMEVVLTVGYYNHLARVISAFQFDVEPDYAKLLPPYPPLAGGAWR